MTAWNCFRGPLRLRNIKIHSPSSSTFVTTRYKQGEEVGASADDLETVSLFIHCLLAVLAMCAVILFGVVMRAAKRRRTGLAREEMAAVVQGDFEDDSVLMLPQDLASAMDAKGSTSAPQAKPVASVENA
jgi:hypothetical protein